MVKSELKMNVFINWLSNHGYMTEYMNALSEKFDTKENAWMRLTNIVKESPMSAYVMAALTEKNFLSEMYTKMNNEWKDYITPFDTKSSNVLDPSQDLFKEGDVLYCIFFDTFTSKIASWICFCGDDMGNGFINSIICVQNECCGGCEDERGFIYENDLGHYDMVRLATDEELAFLNECIACDDKKVVNGKLVVTA